MPKKRETREAQSDGPLLRSGRQIAANNTGLPSPMPTPNVKLGRKRTQAHSDTDPAPKRRRAGTSPLTFNEPPTPPPTGKRVYRRHNISGTQERSQRIDEDEEEVEESTSSGSASESPSPSPRRPSKRTPQVLDILRQKRAELVSRNIARRGPIEQTPERNTALPSSGGVHNNESDSQEEDDDEEEVPNEGGADGRRSSLSTSSRSSAPRAGPKRLFRRGSPGPFPSNWWFDSAVRLQHGSS
ncbi:hypothetical protein DFH07DRAFT_290982 [Mycena maculata]|uniref:Uncharacterized protein n=1 Tax=Mycena maculata TaxID=230809 RepID=A0AAD7JPB4_9AGAR|nr:hypothetical protein DFH07DRAFT_290982 [Mycena maculata]